jgi:putative radical SAM enzyme (TIGR03279 family)
MGSPCRLQNPSDPVLLDAMITLTCQLPRPHDRHYEWREGDALTHLDDRPVEDVLELYYYQPEDDAAMRVRIRRLDGTVLAVSLPPEALDALTSTFAPMEFKRCACNCVFCFIDQNPQGLRAPIYVKDEDYRFSFLYGNYITLTSLGKKGLKRVIEQHLSPLFVSVHCTDTEVRTRMLGIKKSYDVCEVLRALAQNGIELHTQIVLCPGWNDGPHLERSFGDLFDLRRRDEASGGVASLAVVPVGLTAHREGLTRLDPVTPEIAAAVIDQVAPWQTEAAACWEGPFLHLSDEFYLLAGRPFPPAAHYVGFPQEDNGVGLTRRLEEAWSESLAAARQEGLLPRRPLTILTGEIAAQALVRDLIPALLAGGAPHLEAIPVRNDFYGHTVTVAGLLSGRDLRRELLALPARPERTVCLSPRVFNSDGLTLDGLTLDEIAADQPHTVLVPDEEGFVDWWIELDAS